MPTRVITFQDFEELEGLSKRDLRVRIKEINEAAIQGSFASEQIARRANKALQSQLASRGYHEKKAADAAAAELATVKQALADERRKAAAAAEIAAVKAQMAITSAKIAADKSAMAALDAKVAAEQATKDAVAAAIAELPRRTVAVPIPSSPVLPPRSPSFVPGTPQSQRGLSPSPSLPVSSEEDEEEEPMSPGCSGCCVVGCDCVQRRQRGRSRRRARSRSPSLSPSRPRSRSPRKSPPRSSPHIDCFSESEEEEEEDSGSDSEYLLPSKKKKKPTGKKKKKPVTKKKKPRRPSAFTKTKVAWANSDSDDDGSDEDEKVLRYTPATSSSSAPQSLPLTEKAVADELTYMGGVTWSIDSIKATVKDNLSGPGGAGVAFAFMDRDRVQYVMNTSDGKQRTLSHATMVGHYAKELVTFVENDTVTLEEYMRTL